VAAETESVDAQHDGEASRIARLRHLFPSGATAAAVAVAGVALAATSLAVQGFNGHGLIGVVLGPVLALLTAIDLRHRLLPNLIVLPATAVVTAIVAASKPGNLVGHLVAGAVFAGVLLGAALLSRAGVGMGDVKLALLIGIALGGQTTTAVFVTAAASLAVGVVVLVREGRAGLNKTIAYGPLLALGALVAYFSS